MSCLEEIWLFKNKDFKNLGFDDYYIGHNRFFYLMKEMSNMKNKKFIENFLNKYASLINAFPADYDLYDLFKKFEIKYDLDYILNENLETLNFILKYLKEDECSTLNNARIKTLAILNEMDMLKKDVEEKIIENINIERQVEGLSGIIQFTLFSNLNGNKILLLGEEHSTEGICKKDDNSYQEVHNWLYNLAVNAPTCLDVFLESFYRKYNFDEDNSNENDELSKYKSGLSALRTKFEKCNTTLNKKCKFDGFRYHLIDGRVSELPYVIYSNEAKELIKKDFPYKKDEENVIHKIYPKINNLIDENFEFLLMYLSMMFEDEKCIKGKNVYYEIVKMQDLSVDKKLSSKFIKLYEENREKMYRIIQKEMEKIENFNINFFLECLFYSYKNYDKSKTIIDNIRHFLYVIEMDVYFLLRYLHSYDKDKLRKGPKKCNSKEFTKNKYSIVYAGAAHTLCYMNFFILYFNTHPDVHILNPYSEKCIKLPFKFDFFGENKITEPLKISRYIRNSTQFTYFELPSTNRILLFNFKWRHYDEKIDKKYMEINDYLQELKDNSKTCLDIFTNEQISEKYKNKNISSRVHFIDVNKLNNFRNINILNELMDSNYKSKKISLIFENNFYEIIAYLSGIFEFSENEYSDLGQEMYSKYLNLILKKHDSVFGNLLGKNTFKTYMKTYLDYRSEYLNLVNKQISKIQDFDKNYFLKCLFKTYENEKNYNLIVDNINMDVYFLLRYMRRYNLEKLQRGPDKCKNYKFATSKYTIVFSREFNIKIYETFFKIYYKTEPKINVKNELGHIDLVDGFDFFEGI